MEQYQKVTVAGFLVVEGKALMIRRSKQEAYLRGYYELPGGKIDFGENPKQALEREFLEEVNLEVEVVRPYRIFSYTSHKGKRHTVEIVYVVKLKGSLGSLRLSPSHDAVRWVTAKEVSQVRATKEIKRNVVEGFKALASQRVSSK